MDLDKRTIKADIDGRKVRRPRDRPDTADDD